MSQAQKNIAFYVFNTNKTQVELTQGAYVGYSRVIVKDSINNGYEEYVYSSFDEFPNEKAVLTDRLNYFDFRYNFKKEHGLIPSIVGDNDCYRGKLRSKRVFDKNNQLIKEDIWEYEAKIFKNLDLSYDFSESMYRFIDEHEPVLANKEYTNSIALKSRRYLSTCNKSELKTKNGSITEEVITEFDPTYPWPKKITKNNLGENTITNMFYYPYEVDLISSYNSNQKSIIKQYLNKEYCDFSTPLKTEKQVNNNLVKVTQAELTFAGNKIRLSKTKTGRNDSQLKLMNECVKYDSKGNPLEIVNSNGIHTCFIWGYNDQYLLVKFEGITYSNIPNKVISELQTISDTGSWIQLNLINKYKEIRLLPIFKRVMITAYTYKPLIGISSETNANGITSYYEYDGFGRLIKIENDNKETIEFYKYNYNH